MSARREPSRSGSLAHVWAARAAISAGTLDLGSVGVVVG
jgi:hypothetical protein